MDTKPSMKQRNANHDPVTAQKTVISNPSIAQIAHKKWVDEILQQDKIEIPSGDEIWLIKYAIGQIKFTFENRETLRWMVKKYWKGMLSMLPEQITKLRNYENRDKPKSIQHSFLQPIINTNQSNLT